MCAGSGVSRTIRLLSVGGGGWGGGGLGVAGWRAGGGGDCGGIRSEIRNDVRNTDVSLRYRASYFRRSAVPLNVDASCGAG